MIEPSRTNQELLEENCLLHQRIDELERSESKRKQAEEALRESEERFHRLADSTWEGIIIHKEGVIVDVNKSALKMLGYSAEEVTGRKIIDFLAPESREPALQKFREGATHDQLYLEVDGLRKDNTAFSVEVLGRPIRYKNLDARVLSIRDITERKRREEALRERIKELNCLYGISSLLELPGISLDEILKRTVMLIPPAFHFPEIAGAS
ncbi:MAG: PAS domain S-box protein, partial [Methanothrix sp.]|nr:PAS domain S-box protein [Methanothrix sp.]